MKSLPSSETLIPYSSIFLTTRSLEPCLANSRSMEGQNPLSWFLLPFVSSRTPAFATGSARRPCLVSVRLGHGHAFREHPGAEHRRLDLPPFHPLPVLGEEADRGEHPLQGVAYPYPLDRRPHLARLHEVGAVARDRREFARPVVLEPCV